MLEKTFIFVEGVLLTIILFTIHSNVVANERNDESFDDQGLKASKFMPLNKPNLRVKIPQFKNGKLDCLIKADEMIRIDEENVRIQNMNIDFFESGHKEMQVTFKKAKYNFLDNKINSNDETLVIRPNYFTLTGESLEFDVEKKQGRMVGKVKMVLSNSKGLSGVVQGVDHSNNYQNSNFFFLRNINLILNTIKRNR